MWTVGRIQYNSGWVKLNVMGRMKDRKEKEGGVVSVELE